VGEPPIVPAPAAIANAVFDATGARITELPITPERIAMALVAGGRGGR
jgi:CO/xanthine dehydrogenase Mo-binding subunit